ncbi:MAG TPA: hypothetical protein VI072_35855 [Polyangiaceae bacterium]
MTVFSQVPGASLPRTLRGSYLDVVFEVSAAVTVAAYRHVCIVVWRDTPTVTSLLRVDGYLARLEAQHGAVAGVVVVDSLSFRPPDQEARAEHARITRKYETHGRGLAMIIDGASAKRSLFRFVLTTIQLMSSPRVPQRICQSPAEAAGWLAELDGQVQRAELAAAIQAARGLAVQPKSA